MGRYPQEMWPPTLMGRVSYDTPYAFVADLPAHRDFNVDIATSVRAVRNFAIKSGLPNLRVLLGDTEDLKDVQECFPDFDLSRNDSLSIDTLHTTWDSSIWTAEFIARYDIIFVTTLGFIPYVVMELCAQYNTLLITYNVVYRNRDGDWEIGSGPILSPLVEISYDPDDRDLLCVTYANGRRASPMIPLPGMCVDQVPFFEHEVGHMFPSPDKDYR